MTTVKMFLVTASRGLVLWGAMATQAMGSALSWGRANRTVSRPSTGAASRFSGTSTAVGDPCPPPTGGRHTRGLTPDAVP